MTQEADWVSIKNRSYKELIFNVPVTEEQVYEYAKRQNYWGYHPQGYGMSILQQDNEGRVWRYYRFNSCD